MSHQTADGRQQSSKRITRQQTEGLPFTEKLSPSQNGAGEQGFLLGEFGNEFSQMVGTHPKPSQSLHARAEEEIKPACAEIYEMYPRHRDRRFAIASIEKAIKRVINGETGEPMMADRAIDYMKEKTRRFATSLAGRRGMLTPYAATWFNRGGYMDDPHEWDLMNREEYEEAINASRMNVGVWRPE